MRNKKTQKAQTLTVHELKAIQGGVNTPPPSPIPGDQSSDARLIIIDTGKA